VIRFADDEPNGLAGMLGDLIRANLERHPGRASLLRASSVGIRASDIGLSVTLDLEPGRVTISNGLAKGRRDLTVRSDAATLIGLTAIPLRFGLPDLSSTRGREVVRALLEKRLKIDGMLSHPVALTRLTWLLSAN